MLYEHCLALDSTHRTYVLRSVIFPELGVEAILGYLNDLWSTVIAVVLHCTRGVLHIKHARTAERWHMGNFFAGLGYYPTLKGLTLVEHGNGLTVGRRQQNKATLGDFSVRVLNIAGFPLLIRLGC